MTPARGDKTGSTPSKGLSEPTGSLNSEVTRAKASNSRLMPKSNFSVKPIQNVKGDEATRMEQPAERQYYFQVPAATASVDPESRFAFAANNSELAELWRLTRPWWRRLLVSTACAVVVTFVVAQYVLQHWYRALAIIRPASQEGPTTFAGSMAASGLASVVSSLGGGLGLGPAAYDAEEDMAILTSYDFTTRLVEKYGLKEKLATPAFDRLSQLIYGPSDSPWRTYKRMQKLFDCDYDEKTGNLTLEFFDKTPQGAETILGYYLEALRDKLRSRTVDESQRAIAALQAEINKTSDYLVQNQLAAIIAQQLQQEKTAEVQANFAFVVIEPPRAPDTFDRPWVLLDCLVAALATPISIALFLVLRARLSSRFTHRP